MTTYFAVKHMNVDTSCYTSYDMAIAPVMAMIPNLCLFRGVPSSRPWGFKAIDLTGRQLHLGMQATLMEVVIVLKNST